MFQKAIEELSKKPKNYPEKLIIYAPTGAWAISDPIKDKWLQVVADRDDIDRTYIAGLSPDPKKTSIIDRRIKLLLKGGVKVRTLPPQKEFRMGLIHFGDKVLFGFSSANNEKDFRYSESKDIKVIDLFRWLIADATAGSKEVTN